MDHALARRVSTVVADGRDGDMDGVAQQLAGQLADLARHGGREEQVLALRWEVRDDAADRLDEAQVQHLVGLVEHEDLGAARATTLRSPDVVEQAARRGDQHVDAARHGLDLRAVADAAEHDGDGDAEHGGRRCGSSRRSGLQARASGSARARGSPCARRWRRLAARRCRIGSAKAAVLPVPVWAMPEQVAAGQHRRNGLRLDRGRGRIAFALQGLQEGLGEAERGKCRHVFFNLSVMAHSAFCDNGVGTNANRRTTSRGRPAWPGLSG